MTLADTTEEIMSIQRFCLLVGLAIGAVWGLAGVSGAAITAGLAAVGLLVGVVLTRGVDLNAFAQRREEE